MREETERVCIGFTGQAHLPCPSPDNEPMMEDIECVKLDTVGVEMEVAGDLRVNLPLFSVHSAAQEWSSKTTMRARIRIGEEALLCVITLGASILTIAIKTVSYGIENSPIIRGRVE